VRTSFFVVMAHDCLLVLAGRRPPFAQASVHFLLFLTKFVLSPVRAVLPGREWRERPDRRVLMLDNTRSHDGVALASVWVTGVVVLLSPSYSPDFNAIEDVFSVGSSSLRRFSGPEEYSAYPMMTNNSMLEHINGAMCRWFVEAALRRYNFYFPGSQQKWFAFASFWTKISVGYHARRTPAPPRRRGANHFGGGADGSAATARAQRRPCPANCRTTGSRAQTAPPRHRAAVLSRPPPPPPPQRRRMATPPPTWSAAAAER